MHYSTTIYPCEPRNTGIKNNYEGPCSTTTRPRDELSEFVGTFSIFQATAAAAPHAEAGIWKEAKKLPDWH